MPKINRDMTFNEVMRTYPDTVKVFRKYGMDCVGCLGAEAESIEYGAIAHGIDIDSLLEDLNKVVKSGK